jgi:NAD(P) transhydrogenase
VTTRSGKKLTADMVLVSAGRTGNVESLNLASVGLQPDDRGRLKVDDRFRTSVPWIFAAGDLIGSPGLAATSYEQGRIAACEMFGEPHPGMSPHWPFGIYAVPELSGAGQNEEQLTRDCVPYEIGIARYSESARGQIRGDEAGMMKLLFHRETRRLLGVHCIGSQATELVHIGQAVMALGGGLDYFLSTVFNYPTFAECYKVAALNCLNRLRALEDVAK